MAKLDGRMEEKIVIYEEVDGLLTRRQDLESPRDRSCSDARKRIAAKAANEGLPNGVYLFFESVVLS